MGHVLKEETSTMGRWIMWQPAIVELYDNRLLPLASREYLFAYQLPDKAEGLKVKTRVQYHIVTDTQHEMLQRRYGLTGNDPYRFVIYEREFPLTEHLKAALDANVQISVAGSSRHGSSCAVDTVGRG
jgi:hypothetical protein